MSRRHRLEQLRESSPAVLPSLLQCDFGNLQREVERLTSAGVAALHLDVMDGQFVPNLTYGMPIVAGLRRLTELLLDVHLMIAAPERFLEMFVQAGADVITIHVEATASPRDVLAGIRDLGVAAGLAINPGTPMEQIAPCLDSCDLVLVMSVPAGFGGQSFDPVALQRLQQLRETHPQLLLEVDGGINASTAGSAAAAGAQLLVAGSAIFGSSDYEQSVKELTELAVSGASSSDSPDGSGTRPISNG